MKHDRRSHSYDNNFRAEVAGMISLSFFGIFNLSFMLSTHAMTFCALELPWFSFFSLKPNARSIWRNRSLRCKASHTCHHPSTSLVATSLPPLQLFQKIRQQDRVRQAMLRVVHRASGFAQPVHTSETFLKSHRRDRASHQHLLASM